jgi:preprotein translocase subunit SecB
MLNKKETLDEKDCKHLINFSAVSIIINSLRTYILTLTAFAPMGKYTLPAIDMNNLLAEKVRSIQHQVAQEPKAEYSKPV